MSRIPPLLRLIALLTAVTADGTASAGGGPENVMLLVNAGSLNSKTLANHYVALRNIPPSNVIYIDWRGGLEAAQAQFFSQGILQPAIKTINERGLGGQIDYIVYSCDFPTRINLNSILPDTKFEIYSRPEASSTGMTFLWQYVRDKNPALIANAVNWYVSPSGGNNMLRCTQLAGTESRGFRSSYLWGPDGKRTKDRTTGQSYLLSTVLGVTTGRGNSLNEILSYLQRAAEADGTRPRGTFYYMQNQNIRSQTRHDCYAAAAAEVKRAGTSAVVAQGVLPNGAQDVLGIMTGAEKFNIAQSGLRILPGAICDNLTSYGGNLEAKSFQTPLSEFLRAGAAGASGTVFEPTALQSKFPLPSLFIHYARGCSLAESYYQSVAGPYQLLVVGDPLCQPFAAIPHVEVEGLKPGQEVKGTITFNVQAVAKPPKQIGAIELFLDGRLVARFAPGRAPQLDTIKLPDGYHEFRIVAVNADAIESRGRQILPLVINNHGAKLELAVKSSKVAATDMVHITARQKGATSIVVRQNRQEVARFTGSEGQADVLAATLGRGPVVLQAESAGPTPAFSPPVALEIE